MLGGQREVPAEALHVVDACALAGGMVAPVATVCHSRDWPNSAPVQPSRRLWSTQETDMQTKLGQRVT